VLAGLESQDTGTILCDGKEIGNLPPNQRDYGIVFQSYALFPNLTVAQNIAYGIHGNSIEFRAREQRVEQMLELVGLPGLERRYPSQLSGGQQQRVAIARALAISPGLLLLDEPLSALDALERVRLRMEIHQLQKRLGVTTIMVTHDQEEALALADRIVVMNNGRIAQCGTPTEIYKHPANSFVANFIGKLNHIQATASAAHLAQQGKLTLHCASQLRLGEDYLFGIRPEDIEILGGYSGQTSEDIFCARVQKIEYLGPQSVVSVSLNPSCKLELQVQVDSRKLLEQSIQSEALISVRLDPAKFIFLGSSGAADRLGTR
jgi:iron(III) transport system ATP-binding protein